MFNGLIIVFFSDISIFFNLRMLYSSLEVFIKYLMDFNTARGCGGGGGREVWHFSLKKYNNLKCINLSRNR